MPQIRLVALDLDGTLLTSQGAVSPNNQRAIQQALARGVEIVLATGKTRVSARQVIADLGLTSPGVFSQGLVLTNGDGSVLHEQFLDGAVAQRAYQFARERQFAPFAYRGMDVIINGATALSKMMVDRYHEPPPVIVDAMDSWLHDHAINKLLLGSHPGRFPAADIAALRDLVGADGHVTQAVPNFIELMPAGSSKGAGLAMLLNDMAIAPAQVMAIGDGENDIEMLQLVGLAVAVSNAHPNVLAVADHIVASHDQDGVAQALHRFLLSG